MPIKDQFFWEKARGLSDAILVRASHPGVFDVPDGWIKLVNNLDEQLNKIDPNYVIQQVKEKFAGLRFYASFAPSKMEACEKLISAAEEMSTHTCQECGAPGTSGANIRYWLSTLCPAHWKREGEETADKKLKRYEAEAKKYMDAVAAQEAKEAQEKIDG